MTLTVGRLRTRLRSPVPIAPQRCDAWHAAFTAEDGETLCAGLVREGEWLLIRRLRIAARWRADAVDADVGRAWAQALRRGMQEALAGGDDTRCVRYESRRAAIADLLYRSALRETARQWAWHRMGLIGRATMTYDEVLETGVALLLREPELAWPVLQRIVAGEAQTASLTALLRALPAPSWFRLLSACPQTAAHAPHVDEAGPATPLAAADEEALRCSHDAAALFAWAAARPHLARRHAGVLALLLAGAVWPGAAGHGDAPRRRLATLSQRFAGASLRTPVFERGSPPPSPRDMPSAPLMPRADAPALSIDAQEALVEAPSLPELPEPATWHATRFAGALFWLGRISFGRDESGVPLRLHAIARALAVPDDDAAHRAFCGGDMPRVEPPEAIAADAQAQVAQWAAWLDKLAPELPEPRLAAVCRRDGRLRVEPGWIEVHLPLASVDTAIRRIGLDLDSGWLPWLGCVLRVHYDE
jgi:hypothetical protein